MWKGGAAWSWSWVRRPVNGGGGERKRGEGSMVAAASLNRRCISIERSCHRISVSDHRGQGWRRRCLPGCMTRCTRCWAPPL